MRLLLRLLTLLRATEALAALAVAQGPPKPTVLIVSGASHTPKHFEPLQILLEQSGHAVHNPRLPSNSIFPPENSYQHDVQVVRGIAEQLANEGKRIIVLMHSYGGFLGTDAMAGLGLEERAVRGLHGGIKWMAYMTALLPIKGETPAKTEEIVTSKTRRGAGLFKRASSVQDRIILYEDPVTDFYNDLSPEALKWSMAELTGFSVQPFTQRTQHEAWRNISVAYLKCHADVALPLAIQQAMIDRVKGLGVAVKETTSNASHSPYISQPKAVAEWIGDLE